MDANKNPCSFGACLKNPLVSLWLKVPTVRESQVANVYQGFAPTVRTETSRSTGRRSRDCDKRQSFEQSTAGNFDICGPAVRIAQRSKRVRTVSVIQVIPAEIISR